MNDDVIRRVTTSLSSPSYRPQGCSRCGMYFSTKSTKYSVRSKTPPRIYAGEFYVCRVCEQWEDYMLATRGEVPEITNELCPEVYDRQAYEITVERQAEQVGWYRNALEQAHNEVAAFEKRLREMEKSNRELRQTVNKYNGKHQAVVDAFQEQVHDLMEEIARLHHCLKESLHGKAAE